MTIKHKGEEVIARRVVALRELNLSYREIGKILKELTLQGKNGGNITHPEIVKRIINRHNK